MSALYAEEESHGQRQPPPPRELTPEQQKQMEEFKQRTKDMTPEERRAEAEKYPFIKERMRRGGPNPEEQKRQKAWMESLSPEQKQKVQEFRERVKAMTPEERHEAMQKFHSEHPDLTPPPPQAKLEGESGKKQGQRTEGKGGPNPEEQQRQKEWMESLSSEQKQAVQQFREGLKDMNPEERKEAFQKFRSEHPDLQPPGGKPGQRPEKDGKHPPMDRDRERQGGPESERANREIKERFEKLSPEEKQQIQDFRAKAKDMSPEKRREEASKLPVFRDLTPEQRAMLEKKFRQLQQMPPDRKEKFMKNYDKWKQMTPEQREELRKKLRKDQKPPDPQETA
jgi:hypothetical protein